MSVIKITLEQHLNKETGAVLVAYRYGNWWACAWNSCAFGKGAWCVNAFTLQIYISHRWHSDSLNMNIYKRANLLHCVKVLQIHVGFSLLCSVSLQMMPLWDSQETEMFYSLPIIKYLYSFWCFSFIVPNTINLAYIVRNTVCGRFPKLKTGKMHWHFLLLS